ncbi:SIS domain-containing protein [Pseudonocardia kunmingensis]|uniref:Glutamine--fructose-6-phosphate transaminase n=1 Tax=Pseudonocardia kunmingensis TaxID=630975 RepID=A0A543D3J3_9PSEU|nr:SIS domain-containing protein [Pseudonocardia kunmingensis]TQM03901.1 glutamine--fructose-6-phosphate transaminase [Pseudonocardia kunmingensis]
MTAVATDRPGRLMAAEIAEQPVVWRRLLAEGGAAGIDDAAALIRGRRPRAVLFVARGTSDHAALYAKYLVEIRHGLPAGLVSPSTMTAYGARPDLQDVLMIGISQSGGSPDLVRSLEVARAQGALTVAVTNDRASALARAAHAHVDVLAGPERSVAATKSYTAQLLALYLLLERVREVDGRAAAAPLPDLGDALLARRGEVTELAQRYRFAQRMLTTARGYSYPTAREAALKLMETSYVSAQAFSGADLLHGPLALVDPQVPVFAVVADGVGGAAMGDVLPRLAERNADVCCVGHRGAVAGAAVGFTLPEGAPEELSPLLEILPFQLLALDVAVGRGGDPDAPRGLSKITETL